MTRQGPGFELHSMNSQAVLAKVRHGEREVGVGGINDFAENIKLRRKLQRSLCEQPWCGASEAIFASQRQDACAPAPAALLRIFK